MNSSPQPASSTHPRVRNEIIAFIQQTIQLRALELFEQRGREGGRDLEDWLQAEAELTQRRPRMIAA